MLKSDNQLNERIQFGEHLLQSGKTNEALKIFDDVLDKEPDNTIALNDRGVALNTHGRYQDAIQDFLEAIQIDNSNSNAIFNLISNYFAIGNWKEAEKTLFGYEQFLSQSDIEIIRDDLQNTKQVIKNLNSLKSLNLSINQNSVSPDLKLYLDTNKPSQQMMWTSLANNQIYELETLQFFSNVLKAGDCFIDIGAHIGYFSLLSSILIGSDGQVFAFEPETANYIHLNTHIAENNLNNIQAANAALGAKSGKGQLFVNSDNDGGHALWNVGLYDYNKKSRANQTTKDINILSLDDVFGDRELNSLRLIKIDSEGAEHDVLRGGTDTIKKYNYPYIICEINRFALQQMGTNEDALRHFVYELGYNTYLLNNSSSNIAELLPEHHVENDYIFNLLFAKEETLRKDGLLK